ncbi:ADP-ribose pyrophosphatase [Hoeflea phototrophica DFL-43]|jgi:8-oxo-dGTP pyrophosphatase MutT (NUDIX family)|uniref:ADP-ribose pyrophosphatase n=1 Tax=Hoeflea phototrophica (strain DSM 17068 / NCIMB 14078 / DFL-43) TaxID=411684 RepID=A9D132_HOEPD|nr:NUDIX hydrolase [Hoeflea phototrophica]EDQ34373.1 ADP-ribose pyrophosphatase [Hoeflea phototrophica DFL-43]
MSGASRRTIRFNDKGRRFNARVAGLALRDGHLLIHRAVHEPFWTIPGGTAELGEDSRATLVREMHEELGVAAAVGRLVFLVENFFNFEGSSWHEFGWYYLMDLPDAFPFSTDGRIVHEVVDGKNRLEFKWVPATRESLAALPLPPVFLADRIETLPDATEHIAWDDGKL